jgi:hypothetical protein
VSASSPRLRGAPLIDGVVVALLGESIPLNHIDRAARRCGEGALDWEVQDAPDFFSAPVRVRCLSRAGRTESLVLTVPALTLRFRSRYPAVARSVHLIRSEVLDVARDCGADGECLEDIRLAVSEAAREAVTGSFAGAHVLVAIELGDGELVVTLGGDEAGHDDARMRFPCARAVDQERDSAVERLEDALLEQDRLSDRLDAAVGTSAEGTAYTQLRVAGTHVAARQAWVRWVDDSAYRGLSAGAFEFRASDLAAAGLL